MKDSQSYSKPNILLIMTDQLAPQFLPATAIRWLRHRLCSGSLKKALSSMRPIPTLLCVRPHVSS